MRYVDGSVANVIIYSVINASQNNTFSCMQGTQSHVDRASTDRSTENRRLRSAGGSRAGSLPLGWWREEEEWYRLIWVDLLSTPLIDIHISVRPSRSSIDI